VSRRGLGRGVGAGTALPRLAAALVVGVWLLSATRAAALDVKLWPLIDYQSAGEHTHLKLLGPLFEYEATADRRSWALRPLLQVTRDTHRAHSQLSVLYPLFVSRWDSEHTDVRLFGLAFYQQTDRAAAKGGSSLTLFPLVFYRRTPEDGASLSVLPFYADLQNRFGYSRIRMIAFPLYLQLEDDLVEQTWLPFPFVSWSGGPLGRGTRLWPFYGWEEKGYAERSRYVLWPFYISQELHFTRPEREERLLLYPFYASIESPTQETHSYAWPLFFPFLSHTVNRQQQTETWGFPWPFWLIQDDLATQQRTAVRFAPFYEDTRFGDKRSGFLMWPLYRWRTQETDTYRYSRSDVLMVMYRNIREEQPAAGHARSWQTLFPFYRAASRDGRSEFSTLALLDALFPRNVTVAELYAPFWELYTRTQDGAAPAQWSLLWDLVSSDGTRIRYPLHFDAAE
jgi:hypothetical protein